VAEMVLSHCVNKSDSTGTCLGTPDYITYSFEFLDDFYTPYKSIKEFFKYVRQKKSTSDDIDVSGPNGPVISNNNNGEELETLPATESNLTPHRRGRSDTTDTYILIEQDEDSKESWLQPHYNAENHVLNLMVSV